MKKMMIVVAGVAATLAFVASAAPKPKALVVMLDGCRAAWTRTACTILDGPTHSAPNHAAIATGVTAGFVKKVREAGLEFHVWTVDDLSDTITAFSRGVQTVTTNCARKQLDAWRTAEFLIEERGRYPVYDNGDHHLHTKVY